MTGKAPCGSWVLGMEKVPGTGLCRGRVGCVSLSLQPHRQSVGLPLGDCWAEQPSEAASCAPGPARFH